MGLRENINTKPGVAVGIATGLIVLAVAFAIWCGAFARGGPRTAPGSVSFFTDDDGKTFFLDTASKLPPFDHNGKKAYGCNVFTSDGGKTRFVAWLFRYTDEGKKRFNELKSANSGGIGPSPLECIEVKRPGTGDEGWMKCTLPKAMEIQRPPKVAGADATQVIP